MPMKKYAESEGKLSVLRGNEAVVVSQHISKTGKKVSDFSDTELQALNDDLDKVREGSDDEESAE